MIKILFFIEKLDGGGAEKVLRNLVNSMDQLQFDITVQTLWKYDPDKYLVPGIRYRYCYNQAFISDTTWQNKLYNYIFRIEVAFKWIYPLHIKDDYDIEVAYLESGATKVISTSTNKKSKKIAWIHCELQKAISDVKRFTSINFKRYKRFHHIVCVAETVRQNFIYLFGNSMPVAVLYNTIDDTTIINNSKIICQELHKKRITVVIVGRMYSQKNYPRLLRATRCLINEGFDFDLWILGDGADRPKIETYITENGLQTNVTLWGFQDNPYPFMKDADLLVCSSNYEGFSTFITEGLILGKPIVTTDCSGMRELLGDSEYGLITENSDEGFYEGMKRMLTDTDLREHYAAQAKKRGEDFKREHLVKQTENFFMQLL